MAQKIWVLVGYMKGIDIYNLSLLAHYLWVQEKKTDLCYY